MGADHIVTSDRRRHDTAMFDCRQAFVAVDNIECIAMHEIAVSTRLDASEDRMRMFYCQRVPAHMRHLDCRIVWLEMPHLTINPAKAIMAAVLEPTARHQLHTDTNAEEGLARLTHPLFQDVTHAGHRLDPRQAVGKGADAR